ncbi:AraC family transcriptional regulator [Halalkalibacter urbisdiaboli]|uniref:AraC family transcriptional regulator n=1 Tax=Halalkalibacter urbisdiaboli TaxID=1960589 RepID=UPI000B438B9E|nr:helix-turn-helix domain-containing protein [Halalkalibacter urbisdiaboli]
MRSKSLLTKLIIFGCIITVLPVVFLGIFSYSQSSAQIQEKTNRERLQVIRQINTNVEQTLITVYQNLTNVIDSSELDLAIRSSLEGEDFKLYRDLRKEMSKVQTIDSRVGDLVLLNFQEDWLINNSGLYRLEGHPDEDLYLSYLGLEHNSSWLLLNNDKFEASLTNNHCNYTISLVRKLPLKISKKYGLAFANIPTCSLTELVNIDDTSDVLIVDENYKIVVHRDQEMVGQSLLDTGYVQDFDPFEGTSGQFDTVLNNQRFTATYYKSDFNNWTYLSFTSIDHLTAESRKIGWLTFFITFFIIISCVLYVWLLSRKLYTPVSNLMNYIDANWPDQREKKKNELQIIEEHIHQLFSSNSTLESELREHTQQVQSLFLTRLFQGKLSNEEIAERVEYFHFHSVVEKWKQMTVFTLHIDRTDQTKYQAKDMELLTFAVKNIVEETIDKDNRFPAVWIDQTLVILVGVEKENREEIENFVYDITETIQANLEKWLAISVNIGISLPFKELSNANRGYFEGIEALKHRIKLGDGVIIHFNSINSGKHSVIFDYPQRTEEELIVAIKVAEKDQALDIFDAWMEKVFKNAQSPREYQISMMRLLNNLLMTKQESGISFQQLEVYHSSLYEELLRLQTKDEIRTWFQDRLILPLINIFKDRRDSQFHNLSEKIIDLIHKHYDSEITLEECASILHYNANYLSSVFKQETNYTFSEYLAMYRFKIAKEWLIETDMTVKEIADKLQYKNSQNFIRSFKKQEEVTPGQYRQKFKKN